MGISDRIEAFICELLKEDDGWVELGRNELAGIFNCVPSQINYVINTRFTPEKGYAVESRRGGGGYLKIRRIAGCGTELIADIPCELSREEATRIVQIFLSSGVIDAAAAKIINAAVSDRVLAEAGNSSSLRASVLKSTLYEAAVI